MKIRSLFTALTFALVANISTALAQDIVVIGGAKYAVHDVVKGETLYSLAKRYGVTVDNIVAANESLAEGLKSGQRIKIPIVEQSQTASESLVTTKTHKVARRETLYSLSKMYGVTVEALCEANPEVAHKGLKAGQIINIPLMKLPAEPNPVAPPTETPEPTKPEVTVVESAAPQSEHSVAEVAPSPAPTTFSKLSQGDRAEVVLMLPLGSKERPSQNYLDFYRGFLVGLDSVRMSGHSVNLTLFNTAHDYNRVEQIIASGALDKANLVVGPVYEDELIPVAAALQSKGTPIVSPLANLTQTSASNVFQMSPSPATKLNKVRDMFNGSNRVVIISSESIDKEFDAEVRSMLSASTKVVEHRYIYEHPSVIEKREKEREKMREAGLVVDETPSPSDMSPLLNGEEPTVIVITADNEIDVDRILAAIASANISLTARSQRVVPFVVFGNNRWNRYRNIDRAILFSNNVTLLSTYHARRSEPIIRAFDKRFVEEYGTLPSLYAYRGYDAAVVFVKSLYGAMESGMEGAYSRPLLTPYVFEPDAASGLRTNNQWIKVNYNSNFTITTE